MTSIITDNLHGVFDPVIYAMIFCPVLGIGGFIVGE